jgi:hypothetical protein
VQLISTPARRTTYCSPSGLHLPCTADSHDGVVSKRPGASPSLRAAFHFILRALLQTQQSDQSRVISKIAILRRAGLGACAPAVPAVCGAEGGAHRIR